MLLHRLKLAAKFALLLGLSAMAMLAIGALGAATLHQRMLDDRADKLRAVVSSVLTTAKGLQAQVADRQLSREQAMNSSAA